MRIDNIRSDYAPTVGATAQMSREHADAAGRSDPAKVARVIYQLSLEKEPPMRLLTGSDAVFLANVAAAERAKEDARWTALSGSTDFDNLVDFAETPVAKMMAEAS
jgi:hypothetical protein